jgi:DNA-binding winged helix-turn-helix (wHTH) protein/tetratricopeptide (TPR) repeat protein
MRRPTAEPAQEISKGKGGSEQRTMAASDPGSGSVAIGTASYVTATRRLFDARGEEIFLRAQSAEILHFLVLKLGELVSRDALIERVWHDVAVTDDSLTQCIRDVRKAIGDQGRETLVTIPKRGYLLKGRRIDGPDATRDIVFVAEARPQPTAETAAADNRVDHENASHISAELDPRDVLPTLAILPFKAGENTSAATYGIFLADEIAKLLSMNADVNVISRMSTGTFGGEGITPQVARDKLRADFLLSGFVVQRADKVALSIEFSEAETGFVLWAERMQIPFDPMAPETEGLDLVVANIRRAITLNEVRRVASRPLGELRRFSILHGAVGLMHRLSVRDFRKAHGLLEHLQSVAPKHPAPLAWLARWHVLNSAQGWAPDPKVEAQTAQDLTARALDIDPFHTLALVCEGQVQMHLVKDLQAAERSYDSALSVNPNDANGRSLRGMLLAFSDRGDAGRRDTERALHLTPLDPHRFMYLALAAGACIANEDYERALVLTKESLRLNPAHASSLRMLPVAHLGCDQEAKARAAAQDLIARQPDLTVSAWQKGAPSGAFRNGQRFAEMLRHLGIPE